MLDMAKYAQFPYQEYKLYKVFHKKQRRWMAMLVKNWKTDRLTMSFARYRMSVILGKIVPREMEVDHINDNAEDDSDGNLQLLTSEENERKRALAHPAQLIELECPGCGRKFDRPRNRAYRWLHLGVQQYCSRQCSGRYAANNPNGAEATS